MTFTRIASAAAIAFAGILSASAALAAPTIVGDEYQEQMLKNCSNTSSCEVMFTAVPAGKSLIVTDVACVITSANAVNALSISGRKADNTLISRSGYPKPDLIAGGASKRYQAQTKLKHILLTGEKARIFASQTAATGEFVVMCNIFGNLK